MARMTVASLASQVTQLEARIAQLEAAQVAQPAQRAAHSALPRGYRLLVVDGIERFASQDFAYLSAIAKKTKAARPSVSVQIR
jgi:hypothetical protein